MMSGECNCGPSTSDVTTAELTYEAEIYLDEFPQTNEIHGAEALRS